VELDPPRTGAFPDGPREHASRKPRKADTTFVSAELAIPSDVGEEFESCGLRATKMIRWSRGSQSGMEWVQWTLRVWEAGIDGGEDVGLGGGDAAHLVLEGREHGPAERDGALPVLPICANGLSGDTRGRRGRRKWRYCPRTERTGPPGGFGGPASGPSSPPRPDFAPRPPAAAGEVHRQSSSARASRCDGPPRTVPPDPLCRWDARKDHPRVFPHTSYPNSGHSLSRGLPIAP